MVKRNKALFLIIVIIQILTYFAPFNVVFANNNAKATNEDYDIKLSISESTKENPNPNDEKNTLNLEWEWTSKEEGTYRYTMKRTDDTRTTFIDIPNIDTTKEIKVLNVYPIDGVKENLHTWMETNHYGDVQGLPLIKVTPVSLSDFNTNYETQDNDACLKQNGTTGDYKYDVIFFGSADSNGGNGCDLNEDSAKAVGEFIEAGHSAIFGHDTICLRSGQHHPYFAELGEKYVGIVKCDTTYSFQASEKVYINKEGVFTSYPHNIGGEDTVLTIPASHVLGQHAIGDIWLKFTDNGNFYENLPSDENFYLTTYQSKQSYGTCAMIQTGHSSGKATDDEQKIIANLIFFLCNTDNDTSTKLTDISFTDITGPDAPTEIEANREYSTDGNTATISYSANDVGTTYTYEVEARKDGTTSQEPANSISNTITQTTKASGVKEYEYVVDGSASTKLSSSEISTKKTTEETEIVCNINNLGPTYLHIRAIDENGNIGKQADILVAQKEEVKINGIWKDDNDSLTLRPKNLTVTIYKDEETVANKTITLSNTNLTSTVKLDLLDSKGEHTYRVEVEALNQVNDEGDRYVTTVDINGKVATEITGTATGKTTINVTNLLTGETLLEVEKLWNDYNDIRGKRPEELEIELYKNNQNTPIQKANISKADSWKKELFTNLEKYDENGKLITYTVKEVEVKRGDLSEYDADKTTYGNPTREGNKITVTVSDSYVEKNTIVEGEITQVGTPTQIGENVSGTNPEVEYEITFKISIDQFAGVIGKDLNLALIYELSADNRINKVLNVGDGYYNESENAIVWIITHEKVAELLSLQEDEIINTYKNGKAEITITKTIKLSYTGMTLEDSTIKNSITGSIELDYEDSEKVNKTYQFNCKTETALNKGKLVVRYLDVDNNNSDIVVDGETTKTETEMLVGNEYTTSAKEFEDYVLKQEAGNKIGKVSGTGNTEVIYYYNQKHYNVEASIKDGEIIIENGTTRKTLKNTDTTVNSKLTMDVAIHNQITVKFEPKNGYYVKSIQIDDKTITSLDEISKYLKGNKYEITINDEKDETGKEHTHEENKGGIMKPHNISVVCERIPVKLTVKYVDENGNDIPNVSVPEVGDKYLYDTYKIEAQKFEDYDFDEVITNPKIKATVGETVTLEGNLEVTYKYHKKQYDVEAKITNGTIEIGKTNEESTKADTKTSVYIHDNVTVTFKPDEGYSVISITINGQRYSKEQLRKYYKGGEITIENITENYKIEISCEKKSGKIVVEYRDKDGNQISDSTIIEGEVGDIYTLTAPVIEGYVANGIDGEETGLIEEETKTITYFYKATVEKDESPKTGVLDITNYVVMITLIAMIGIVVLTKKLNKYEL